MIVCWVVCAAGTLIGIWIAARLGWWLGYRKSQNEEEVTYEELPHLRGVEELLPFPLDTEEYPGR